MRIRLIAGEYGGRVIDGSGTNKTHPMSERLRGAIFNMIGGEIVGARVLDAFAGSGALGLEALSRGASSADFVEKDRIAQKIITNNIEALGVGHQARLYKAPVASWIESISQQDDTDSSTTDGNKVDSSKANSSNKYDIIFADPPYNDPQLSTVFKLKKLLQPNGLMVLSYISTREVPTELGVVVVDNRSYGNAALALYRRKGA